MDITIRRLTPELAEDYVHFFDTTPHDDGEVEHSCYCVCWCSEESVGVDFSTAGLRRELALQYVKSGALQGYLAYEGDKIVGWCNANTKSDCSKCASWRRFMDYIPKEPPGSHVKSVFCFVIAPELKRRGIATQLLERVCADAAADGFDAVEAYPFRRSSWQLTDFAGHAEMYARQGFAMLSRSKYGIIMRKPLK